VLHHESTSPKGVDVEFERSSFLKYSFLESIDLQPYVTHVAFHKEPKTLIKDYSNRSLIIDFFFNVITRVTEVYFISQVSLLRGFRVVSVS